MSVIESVVGASARLVSCATESAESGVCKSERRHVVVVVPVLAA
jgi:hypothetical protein